MKKVSILALVMLSFSAVAQQDNTMKIAKLKYHGGGDWYANKTALPNLAKFCNETLGTALAPSEDAVDVGSPEIFLYPYVYMTGHGNVLFSDPEATNLREYLVSGGFLHIDDNYGLDQFVRLEMKKVFPELEFIELPFSHPIYHQKYQFADGLPKIHEHDGKAPMGYGLIYEGRRINRSTTTRRLYGKKPCKWAPTLLPTVSRVSDQYFLLRISPRMMAFLAPC